MTAPEGPDWEANYLNCLRCGTRLEMSGTESFRVGGHSGATHLFLGNLAELGEGTIRLEIWWCPTCGMVELRSPRK